MSNPDGRDWPNTDPAYSGQYPAQYPSPYWSPAGYGPGYGAPMTQPTEQIPSYWQTGPVTPTPPPPPEPPKPTRWPWIAAGGLVFLITGLVLALVIVSSSSKEDTVVAPPTTSRATPKPATPTTPTRLPSPTTITQVPLPPPPTSAQPTEPEEPALPTDPDLPAPAPAVSEPVVYTVSGEGRAINITYVDTGGIMQTEFNVVLPWSKEVSLAAPAMNSASVAIINVGRDVTCSLTVNGVQVRQRTGQGLTICTGMG